VLVIFKVYLIDTIKKYL